MKTLSIGLVFLLLVAFGIPHLEAQTRWADDVRITDLSQDAGPPKLVALDDGTLYMACSLAETSSAGLYRSDDGGASWALDRYISSPDPVIPISIVAVEGEKLFVSLKASSGPFHELRVWWLDLVTESTGYAVVDTGDMSMQISGGTLCVDDHDYPDNWRVYVGYEVFDNSVLDTSFRCALSADQGGTWTNYTSLGGVEGDYAGIDIAYGNGVLYYVYSFSWQFSPPEIRLRKSTNRGVSWGSNLTVETLGIASLWPKIVAAASEPTVAVCFDDGIADDLAVRVSYDAGLSWTPANPPNDPGERELYPQLALCDQDEKLALAWWQDGDPEQQIKICECELSSPTMWTTPESIVDADGIPAMGPPSMAIDGARDDATCVAWSDLRHDPVTTVWFDSQTGGASEELDQYQDVADYAFWFDSDIVRWQEFSPSVNILTAVEVNITRLGNPGNMLLEIRTQDEVLLGQEMVMEEDIPVSSWVRVELSEAITLNTWSIFRIYLSADAQSPDPSNRYFWRGSTDSAYNPECACSVQEGNHWPNFDFAFLTWGYHDPAVLANLPGETDHRFLLTNWPNPFNPRTTIRFELGDAIPYSLNIYDVSGRLVRALGKGRAQTAGLYELHWDGRNRRGQQVPSGVYLYRLQAGALAETRRMVLVR